MAKILLVDDDEELCEELALVLESEGFDVDVAFDGIQGLRFLEGGGYQVIILDLKLPGVNGFGVLKTIKQGPSVPRVIVVSGRPTGEALLKENGFSQEDEEQILKLADVMVNKPFKVEFLIQKIKELWST